MKLYIYDHCPFCTRARMAFGLYGIPFETVILANDDEATPIGLIGAKQVPILQKPDGTYMGESLDIVTFLGTLTDKVQLAGEIRPQIQQWFKRVDGYYNRLVMPRDVQLNLPEFAKQSAIDYFVAKKEAYIGKFDENLRHTQTYLAQLDQDLAQLETLVLGEDNLNGVGASMEDILLFPVLRNLTMVRGVNFPQKTAAYIHAMSARCGVNLYFDCAV